MATIIYGKSVAPRENAKSRRLARRRDAAIERDALCAVIAKAFGEPVEVETKTQQSRVDKALGSIDYKMKPARSDKDAPQSGAICLPNVAIYSAGHRKSENITCRGTQKFKGKSIALI